MAARFRKDGWEARQETPPQSYLHVSKPNWKDQHMNGIHLETYVLGGQLKNGYAPVCLHCERGFPRQAAFMKSFTLKAKSRLEELGFTVKGPSGCSICELLVEIRGTPEATCAALEAQIRRLQELAPLIDETIAEVCA